MITDWLVKIGNDSNKWHENEWEKYPAIIVNEYSRLKFFSEMGNVYGVLLQIKDFFEVLVKYPSILALCILAKSSSESEIAKEEYENLMTEILEKRLSLGDWMAIAKKASSVESVIPISLRNILCKTFSLFYEPVAGYSNVIQWRNSTIGHGALRMEDDESLKTEICHLIDRIHRYFSDDVMEAYSKIQLFNGDSLFVGKNALFSNRDNNEITLSLERERQINDLKFLDIYNGSVCFFDSFLKFRSKTKFLDYATGREWIRSDMYFFELYQTIKSKFNKFKNVALLDDESSIGIEQELNQLYSVNDFMPPNYVYDWIRMQLKSYDKGVFLIKMERGLGKTALTTHLDQRYFTKNYLGETECIVRTYHFGRNQIFSINDFIGIMNQIFKMQRDSINQILEKNGIFSELEYNVSPKSPSSQMADLLNSYSEYYKAKGFFKLILILDGVDEIKDLKIFDYIPKYEQLHENVYIFLTSRLEYELEQSMANIIADVTTSVRNELIINNQNESYRSLIYKYVQKYITDSNVCNQILIQAQYNFLRVKIYIAVSRKNLNFTVESPEKLFVEFLKILKDYAYGERSFNKKIVRFLCILQIFKDGLTFHQLAVLMDSLDKTSLLATIHDTMPVLTVERLCGENTLRLANEEYFAVIQQMYSEDIESLKSSLIQEMKDASSFLPKDDGELVEQILFGSFPFEEKLEEISYKSRLDFILNNLISIIPEETSSELCKNILHYYLRVIVGTSTCLYDVKNGISLVLIIIEEIQNTLPSNWRERDVWSLFLINRIPFIRYAVPDDLIRKTEYLIIEIVLELTKRKNLTMTASLIFLISRACKKLHNDNFMDVFFRIIDETGQTQSLLTIILNESERFLSAYDEVIEFARDKLSRYAREHDQESILAVMENAHFNSILFKMFFSIENDMNELIRSYEIMREYNFTPRLICNPAYKKDYHEFFSDIWSDLINCLYKSDKISIEKIIIKIAKYKFDYFQMVRDHFAPLYMTTHTCYSYIPEISTNQALAKYVKSQEKYWENYIISGLENITSEQDFLQLSSRLSSRDIKSGIGIDLMSRYDDYLNLCSFFPSSDTNMYAEWVWNLFDEGNEFTNSMANFEINQWKSVFENFKNMDDSINYHKWLKQVSDRWGIRLRDVYKWNEDQRDFAVYEYLQWLTILICRSFQTNDSTSLKKYVRRGCVFLNKIDWLWIPKKNFDTHLYSILGWSVLWSFLSKFECDETDSLKERYHLFFKCVNKWSYINNFENLMNVINLYRYAFDVAKFLLDFEGMKYFANLIEENIQKFIKNSEISRLVEKIEDLKKSVEETLTGWNKDKIYKPSDKEILFSDVVLISKVENYSVRLSDLDYDTWDLLQSCDIPVLEDFSSSS